MVCPPDRNEFLCHGWPVSCVTSLATLQHQVTIYIVRTSQMRHLYLLLRHFSYHLEDISSHASVIVTVWSVFTGTLTRNFPPISLYHCIIKEWVRGQWPRSIWLWYHWNCISHYSLQFIIIDHEILKFTIMSIKKWDFSDLWGLRLFSVDLWAPLRAGDPGEKQTRHCTIWIFWQWWIIRILSE